VTLVDEQIPGVANILAEHDDVLMFAGRTLTRERLIELGATALLVRSTTPLNEALLDGTSVQFAATATAGTDHVDLSWLASHDITFAAAPGSNAWAVAEYVMSTILHHRSNGRLLIIGHGNVGSRLALAARHYGFQVGISDPPLGLQPDGGLDEWLRSADVTSLHVPLTHEGDHATHHLIGEKELSVVKSDALLFNTSRGGVVDERYLRRDVNTILDVFEGEPSIDPRTADIARWITPHIAGYSIDAKLEGARMVGNAWLEWKGLEQRIDTVVNHNAPKYGGVEDLRPVHEEASWFRQQWNKAPFPATFDEARKSYQLRREVLRHVVHSDT